MSLEEEIGQIELWESFDTIHVFEIGFKSDKERWLKDFFYLGDKDLQNHHGVYWSSSRYQAMRKIIALIEDQKGEALLSSFKWIRAVAKEIQ